MLQKIIIYTSNNKGDNRNVFNEFLYDDLIICPTCLHITRLFHTIQWASFSGLELFCCTMCNTQSLILQTTTQYVTIKQAVELTSAQKINELLEEYTSTPNTSYTIYTFDLANILKVSNKQCYSHKLSKPVDFTPILNNVFIKGISRILDMYLQFSAVDMRRFIACPNDKQKIIDTFNLQYDGITPDTFNFYNIQNTHTLDSNFWAMSLDVNSYNLNKPLIEYPINFQIGESSPSLVHLLYSDSNNNILNVSYSSDCINI